MSTSLLINFCGTHLLVYLICALNMLASHGLNQTFCVPWCEMERKSFPWNKMAMTSLKYQLSFCSRRCRGTQLVVQEEHVKCANINCFPCDCNKPLCRMYGTCCPDIPEPVIPSMPSAGATSSVKINFPERDSFNGEAVKSASNMGTEAAPTTCGDFLYVRSCPSYFSFSTDKARCEHDVPVSEMDAQTYVHVTDNSTGVTYFNEYCARCNNVSEFSRWDVSIACEKVLDADDDDDLLRLALQTDSLCNVSHIAPNQATECIADWFDDIVNICNATGLWVEYDENVVEACASPSFLRDRVCSKNNCYKNIFCAICNMDSYPVTPSPCKIKDSEVCRQKNDCISAIPGAVGQLLPFSLLINFGSNQNSMEQSAPPNQNCSSSTEWAHPDGKCLPLNCSPRRKLINGKCYTAVHASGNKTSLLYIPLILRRSSTDDGRTTSLNSDEIYPKSQEDILYKFIDTLMGYKEEEPFRGGITRFAFAFQEGEPPNMITKIDQIKWFAVEYISKEYNGQNQGKYVDLISNDLSPKEFNMQINPTTTLTFAPTIVPYDQEYIIDYFYLDSKPIQFVEKCTSDIITVISNNTSNVFDCNLTVAIELACPFVTFNQTDYTLQISREDVPPTSIIALNLTSTTFVFEEPTELDLVSVDESGNLNVCREVLDLKLSQRQTGQVNKYGMLFRAQQLLTIVCVSVSLLCLLLTLITYIIFSELRNEAGENNSFLCSSLCLAQLSLLVASQINDNGFFCTFFGISIHFFWLNTFCWSFTCSFHMFRTFTAKTRNIHSLARSNKLLVLKVVVCLAVPAVVVLTVMGWNLLTSEGKLIGYGERRCSLDSALLLSVTVVAPIVAILLCNIAFFLTTVIHIHNVRKLQSADIIAKRDISQNIYIYCKLSTMTGAFWAVVIVSEATDLDPVRIMAIILNGLQGVFIFVSFTCNKRVLTLYRRRCYNSLSLSISNFTNCSEAGDEISQTTEEAEGIE